MQNFDPANVWLDARTSRAAEAHGRDPAWPCLRGGRQDLTSPSTPPTASSRRSAASRSTSSRARRSASSASPAPARASSTQTITGLTRGATVAGTRRLRRHRPARAPTPSDAAAASAAPQIGMIFQDPLSSLHPLLPGRLADRRDDPRPRHGDDAGSRPGPGPPSCSSLVGIPRAAERIDDYPHQFSGGMRQRVMIAMAMALNPDAADRRRADHRARRHRAGPGARRDAPAAGASSAPRSS